MTDSRPMYLLDTAPLTAYFLGRVPAVRLIQPWLDRREVVTSILCYGELVEYLAGLSDSARRRRELRRLLEDAKPVGITYAIMDRYADLRRQLRPPHGPGLIGDIDTLIAATALEHDLTLVTTDADFGRVPDLKLRVVPPLR